MHILDQERRFERFFEAFGWSPARISYEDMVDMGDLGAVPHVLRRLGRTAPEGLSFLSTGHRKIGTDRNALFAARFRKERAELVSSVAAERKAWG